MKDTKWARCANCHKVTWYCSKHGCVAGTKTKKDQKALLSAVQNLGLEAALQLIANSLPQKGYDYCLHANGPGVIVHIRGKQ
jgi:hypothetical protein